MKYAEALRNFQLRYWVHMLYLTDGNVTKAAKLAGCNRTYLHKIINRLSISRPPSNHRNRAAIGAICPINDARVFLKD